mgnify:FL=1|jgi:hypothetical protein
MIPPPIYEDGVRGHEQWVTNEVLPQMINDIGLELNRGPGIFIDVFNNLGGANLEHWELTDDNVYPNEDGYALIAHSTWGVLKFRRMEIFNGCWWWVSVPIFITWAIFAGLGCLEKDEEEEPPARELMFA